MKQYHVLTNLLSMLVEVAGVLWFYRRLERHQNKWRQLLALVWLVGVLALIYVPLISTKRMFAGLPFSTVLDQLFRTGVNYAAVWGYLAIGRHRKGSFAYPAAFYILLYMAVYNIRAILFPVVDESGGYGFELSIVVFLAALQWGTAWVTSRLIDVTEIRKAAFSQFFVVITAILTELYLKWNWIFATSNKESLDWETMFYAIFTVGSIFLLGIFAERYGQLQRREARLQLEQLQTQYEMQNVKRELSANTDIRQLYHDMKNHILALRTMADSGEETKAYLDQLCSQFEGYESSLKTGNSTVDSLLSEKLQRARLHGMGFNVCADLSDLAFVTAVDLVTIFGNAVDNAVEALDRLPEDTDRMIYIKTMRYANMVLIRFSNQFSGTLECENGELRTTKEDQKMHGIGLRSIRKAARKYGGYTHIEVDNDEGWFRLMVLIPTREN